MPLSLMELDLGVLLPLLMQVTGFPICVPPAVRVLSWLAQWQHAPHVGHLLVQGRACLCSAWACTMAAYGRRLGVRLQHHIVLWACAWRVCLAFL